MCVHVCVCLESVEYFCRASDVCLFVGLFIRERFLGFK